ncbi:DUF5678 domain-containing protein [candidate division KSB1 bacterium]|nr:DUF5678 domain-containing protein [candidate division KSB1 bacterium]
MKAKTLLRKLGDFQEDKINEEVILEKLRSSEADSIWFNEHYEELKAKYKNEWVAVFRKKVVDHHRNQKVLLRRLRENYPQDSDAIVVEFVSLEDVILIL